VCVCVACVCEDLERREISTVLTPKGGAFLEKRLEFVAELEEADTHTHAHTHTNTLKRLQSVADLEAADVCVCVCVCV
jgi:hypothetical protein